jgi:hypothetical protein
MGPAFNSLRPTGASLSQWTKLAGDTRRTRLNMNNSMRESVELSAATERRADAALRWHEERYRTLFDLGVPRPY